VLVVRESAYKVIDTAAKKNVMPKNTASRRKSKLARSVAGIKATKKKEETPAKKAAPKKAAAKKPAAKKAPAKMTAAKKPAAKKAPAKKKAATKKAE